MIVVLYRLPTAFTVGFNRLVSLGRVDRTVSRGLATFRILSRKKIPEAQTGAGPRDRQIHNPGLRAPRGHRNKSLRPCSLFQPDPNLSSSFRNARRRTRAYSTGSFRDLNGWRDEWVYYIAVAVIYILRR